MRLPLLKRRRSSLLQDLVAYWKLDEASGTRYDAKGDNHLTDNNTVTQTTGKLGSGACFASANSEYLSAADNAALSLGGTDFTLAAWIKLTVLNQFQAVLAKYNRPANDREYLVQLSNANLLRIFVSDDGVNDRGPVVASSFGALAADTWYHVIAWHAAGQTLNICVNNGVVDSVAYALGVRDGGSDFTVGALDNGVGATPNYFDGCIDSVGLWKRVLTAAERASLYNGGAGKEYPF